MSHFHLFAKDLSPQGEETTYAVSVSLSEATHEEGNVILFPPCQDAKEFNEAIDRLITQLNAVRHKAKEKIADRLRD